MQLRGGYLAGSQEQAPMTGQRTEEIHDKAQHTAKAFEAPHGTQTVLHDMHNDLKQMSAPGTESVKIQMAPLRLPIKQIQTTAPKSPKTETTLSAQRSTNELAVDAPTRPLIIKATKRAITNLKNLIRKVV